MKANNDIRIKAKEKGIHLWEVADRLNITDATFSRKLRKELPSAEKEKILAIIDELAKEKAVI